MPRTPRGGAAPCVAGNLIRYRHDETPAVSLHPALVYALLHLRLSHIQRSWGTDYVGSVYVHGSAWRPPREHIPTLHEIQRLQPGLRSSWLPSQDAYRRFAGRIAAVAWLRCSRARGGGWLWSFSELRAIDRPVPARGHQLLWPVSRGVSAHGIEALGDVRGVRHVG